MMSFTEVFLLVFALTSFFLHYVQLVNIKRLEDKVSNHETQLKQPIQIEVYDDEGIWR